VGELTTGTLAQEETRAVLAATEQALAAEEAAAAGSLSEAAAAEAGVRAMEAHLSAVRQAAAAAEQQAGGHTTMVEYTAPAGGVLPAGQSDDGSRSVAQVAHALSEVVVLLRSLGGLDVMSARPDALVLRCTAGTSGAAHALALRLEASTAKVVAISLEPGTVSQQALDAVVSQAQGKVHVIVREVRSVPVCDCPGPAWALTCASRRCWHTWRGWHEMGLSAE
jgi:hypothetical protein